MPIEPQHIVDHLREQSGRPLKAKELAKALGVANDDYSEFKELLRRLEDEGAIYRVKQQRYAAPQKINLVVGRLQTIRSGAGFVSPDQGDEDLFIPPHALESAVDGDRVVARIERRRRGERAQGTVIKVLERARSRVVGEYHTERNFGFVEPDDQKLKRDVFIPPDAEMGAQDGDLVVVEIESWGDDRHGPAGRVVEVLGPRDRPGVDVLAILHDHELPASFPPDVQAAAVAINRQGIRAKDLQGREDLRHLLVATIDPVDAKDHDDALSVVKVGEDYEVGIHIADVSHYVEEGEPIDIEAFHRGTSVYLVDRVVPMLPHELSGDLCSLKPDVDRLAMSLLVRLSPEGEMKSSRLVRSVIRSRHKLSYEAAQAIMDGRGSGDAALDESLQILLMLSRQIRAQRLQRGSIDFDLPEARVLLNAQGEPTDIQRVLRLESHRLIEDFMILANETVARRASRAKLPFIYRIHEAPDQDRVEQLGEFVRSFGLRFRPTRDPKAFQALIEQVQGRPEEGLVSTVVLRSMKQARYSAENVGHFGLASQHYAHFTSPIRRYPDLVVHRLLARAFIEGERLDAGLSEELIGTARRSSERERVATSAERESIALKKVEFMERHLGDEFEGTISSVTSFGFFVLLDAFFVEGLVHVNALEDDYYVFLDEQYALQGENSGRRFRTGDRVKVRVASIDRQRNQIDLMLIQDAAGRDPTGRGARGRGGAARGADGADGTGGSKGRKGGEKGGRGGGGAKIEGGRGRASGKGGRRGDGKGGRGGPKGKPGGGRGGGRSGGKKSRKRV
ncbi:MAG TPA: ribonuclease R [Longimicrobiales bacterium]